MAPALQRRQPAQPARRQLHRRHLRLLRQHGRAILNEVFWFEPLAVLGEITAPTLLVHGTKDTFVPVEDSRAAAPLLVAEHRLVEIEGSQHGFAVHDDPQYLNPQSQAWQALVIETIAEWITASL
jgi:uncharacterized protein